MEYNGINIPNWVLKAPSIVQIAYFVYKKDGFLSAVKTTKSIMFINSTWWLYRYNKRFRKWMRDKMFEQNPAFVPLLDSVFCDFDIQRINSETN